MTPLFVKFAIESLGTYKNQNIAYKERELTSLVKLEVIT